MVACEGSIQDQVERAAVAGCGGDGWAGAAPGRSFEARAFLTIELAQDPARDDLRAELERLKAEEGKKATWKGTLANRVEHDRMRD